MLSLKMKCMKLWEKTGQPIQTWRLDLVFINKEKITYNQMDFAVPEWKWKLKAGQIPRLCQSESES